MSEQNSTKTESTEDRKYPILFHGGPLPEDWTAEKASAQLAKMPGKVYSGRELAERVGLTRRKTLHLEK